jgi:hypothetical protein
MIDFNITNTTIFADLVDQLQKGLTRGEKDEIRTAVANNYNQVWRTRGGSIGPRWKNNVTLVDTGRLKKSLTIPSGKTTRFSRRGFRIRSEVPYSSFVNARYEFLDLSNRTLDAIAKVYTRAAILE